MKPKPITHQHILDALEYLKEEESARCRDVLKYYEKVRRNLQTDCGTIGHIWYRLLEVNECAICGHSVKSEITIGVDVANARGEIAMVALDKTLANVEPRR